MKPNPEQDADRAAFEKWCLLAGYSTCGHPAADRAWQAWQAATANYQDALLEAKKALETASRFYAKKSRPPTPEYLVRALSTINKLLGEK